MLPKLPKLFASDGSRLGNLLYSWISPVQDLLSALRSAAEDADERLDDLEAGGGGSGSVTFGSPVALPVGGANTDGVSTDAARADHKHALPDFGTGSGDFCEGDDSRLSDDRTASGLRTASTVVSISGATAPSADQVLVATGSTAATWQNLTDVVLDSLMEWVPDWPPDSPNAADDECEDSNTTGWSEWDVGGNTTLNADSSKGLIYIEKTSTGADDWSGMYKAVPSATNYSLYAKIGISGAGANSLIFGLMLAEDLSSGPATADFKMISLVVNSADNFVQHRASTAQNLVGSNGGFKIGLATSILVRIRVTSTLAAWDYSTDGISWIQVASSLLGFTPVHMGFCLYNRAGITARGYVHWFRVVETTPSIFDTIGARKEAAYVP